MMPKLNESKYELVEYALLCTVLSILRLENHIKYSDRKDIFYATSRLNLAIIREA